MISIVFFDAGETLVHPHPSFAELFAVTCSDSGHPVSARDVDEVQRRLAPHLVDVAEDELAEEGARYGGSSSSSRESRIFWTALYRRLLRELGIDDAGLADRLFEVFSSASSYALFDDVAPVLRELEAMGLRLGVISNFEGWLQEMLMELEIGHLFDVSVISGLVGVEKPDPRIYEIALAEAGVEPHAAVHVGDSPQLDVEPAAAVGMHGVLLDRLGRYPGVGHPRISSLRELPGTVAGLRRGERPG